MSNFKTIAVALALNADADESAIIQKFQTLKLDKEKAEEKVTELENKFTQLAKEEGTDLINKVVDLGILPEGLKAVQLSAYELDPAGQKVILTKLIADKEAENKQSGNHTVIKDVILNGKKPKGENSDAKETFDYLQRFDHVKLGKIKQDDPAKYAQLADDYEKGVRYAAK